MLSKVRVYNDYDEYIEFHVGYPPSGYGFLLTSADGLGPVKAELNYGLYSLIPGGSYRGSTTGIRNINLSVDLLPNYANGETPETLRRLLNKFMAPEKFVRLYIYQDGLWTLWIHGYVEDNVPTIFTQTPGASLTVVCMEPSLKSRETKYVDARSSQNISIEHLGDVEHGFQMTVEMTPTSNMQWFSIQNTTTGDGVTLYRPGTGQGEIFQINTLKGSKQFDVVNSAGTVQENVIGFVEVTNEWPYLLDGHNNLRLDLAVGGTGAQVRVAYRDYYSGI